MSFWKNPCGRSLFRTSTVLEMKKDSYGMTASFWYLNSYKFFQFC
jgi:hypothetical protein